MAAGIAEMWWIMLAGAVLIFVGVMLAALYALKPSRGRGVSERWMLLGGGLIFPTVTLTALLVYSLVRGEMLQRVEDEPWRVDAVSRQWVWEFNHLDAEGGPVRTVGTLFAPVGRTIELRVSSEDVIHSFWAPRLGGKIDAIPGKTNTILLIADEAGDYLGQCAEFCGAGHAHMRLVVRVIADEAELVRALEGERTDG